MSMHVNDAGTWKDITEAHVNVSGVWKRVYSVYQRVSGVWKLIDQYLPFNPGGAIVSFSSEASLQVNRDGTITVVANGGPSGDPNWILPAGATVGDDYEVRFTRNSGTVSDYGTAGVWLALTSDRKIGYNGAEKLGNWTVEIRHAGNTDISVSATLTITATSI